MDVEAEGLFQKGLGDTEKIGQIPQLGMSGGDGIVQGLYRNQAADRPLVRPVFVAAPQVGGGVDIIKGYLSGLGSNIASLFSRADIDYIASHLNHSASLFSSHLSIDAIISGIQASGTNLIMAVITVVVLCSLAVWDVVQSDSLS